MDACPPGSYVSSHQSVWNERKHGLVTTAVCSNKASDESCIRRNDTIYAHYIYRPNSSFCRHIYVPLMNAMLLVQRRSRK